MSEDARDTYVDFGRRIDERGLRGIIGKGPQVLDPQPFVVLAPVPNGTRGDSMGREENEVSVPNPEVSNLGYIMLRFSKSPKHGSPLEFNENLRKDGRLGGSAYSPQPP